MNTFVLRHYLVISFLAHTTLVSSVTFSLVPHRADTPHGQLYFLRVALPAVTVRSQQPGGLVGFVSGIPPQANADSSVRAQQAELFAFPGVYLKPCQGPAFEDSKGSVQFQSPLVVSAPQRKDTSIMFHPLLPYQLQLYFNDRQAVHIELLFKPVPGIAKRSLVVKRKISSGNLEADLLSMRYMQHYLYIQKERFSPDNWQTVRIDLSSKNDQP